MSLIRTITLFFALTFTEPGESGSTGTKQFEFNRIEPGKVLGITTKVIAHVHRPADSMTETWRLNREFTPDSVLNELNSTCDRPIVREKHKRMKWGNCKIDEDGFTGEMTHGRPETKNKTYEYLALTFEPFDKIENGRTKVCALGLMEEDVAYFLVETYTKIPSNNGTAREQGGSSEPMRIHQLGKIGQEFLRFYGDIIDQDSIYNFDVMDYYDRDFVYDCFLSIGKSESVAFLEENCPIYCMKVPSMENFDILPQQVYTVRPMLEKKKGNGNWDSDEDTEAKEGVVFSRNEL